MFAEILTRGHAAKMNRCRNSNQYKYILFLNAYHSLYWIGFNVIDDIFPKGFIMYPVVKYETYIHILVIVMVEELQIDLYLVIF